MIQPCRHGAPPIVSIEGGGEIVNTRTLEAMAATVEATTGLALIADPVFVVHLLLGASLSSGGIAVGRVCGFGLLSLGLA